ncbi:ABC-type glycerol-3-phosphate transport system, substrate-binding protein [Ruminococcus sp. YRD2003]|uniref:ABC transporter substrate-binding protein n=1 Tax=Ruminococcus sp. YRD2003 TaxID=1452313 RepID=UPI0008C67C08|nr:ABC-type glycerol-3-phosphate transport system, substrate-binding protein [Ruminococcus flavefaciens]
MKKLLSLLMAVTMLAAVGCTSKGGSSSTAPEAVIVSQTNYKEERAEKPQGFGSLLDMAYVEDKGTRVLWDSTGKFSFADYDEEMKPSAPTELYSCDDYFNSLASIAADGTMSLFIIHAEFSKELTDPDHFKTGEYSYEIRTFDVDGAELSAVELTDFGDYITPYEAPLTHFCPYGDGWIIGCQTGRWLIGADGTVSESSDDGMTFEAYGIDSDGRYIHAKDVEFCYMDGKSLRDPVEMTKYGEFLRLSQGIFTGAGDYKAFFVLQDGIFGLTADGQVVKVLGFVESHLTLMEIYALAYVGEGKFALYGGDDAGTYFSLLTVRPDDYVENREKYTVGVLSKDARWSKNHEEMIAKYNKKSDSYEGELKYFTSGLEGLSTDILGGNSPDVIVINGRRDMTRLYNLGALADMNELSEQYGGFNEDDILDNVVEAYKYKDGLYMMSQTFTLPVLLGKKKYFPNGNVTMDEFIDIASNMPKDMTLGGDWLFRHEQVMANFVTGDLSAWVDFDNAECWFDSPEFVKLLEFTHTVRLAPERDWDEFNASMSDEEQYIYSTEVMHSVANEKSLIDGDSIGGLFMLSDIREQRGLSSDDVVYLATPSDDPKSSFSAQNDNIFSVLKTGKCMEGGWDYVNFIMSDDFLRSYLQTESFFHTRKDSFEQTLIDGQYRSQHTTWTDESGQTHASVEFGVDITDEDITKLKEYISTCTNLISADDEISSIIMEEYGSFDSGEVSAEECAKRIQNRVSLMLSEQS